MKKMLMMILMTIACSAMSEGTVAVKSVTAQQRYPWNGLVDIVVMLEGSADDVANSGCSLVATNCATGSAVPITSIAQKGADSGSGKTWMRRFVWNATNDVGVVKIDDLALTVDTKVLGCVQLWDGGPYWAECNVGASKPEGYGYYFWWGDTVGYERNASNDGWISVKNGAGFSFSSGNCPTYGMDNSQLLSDSYIDLTGNLVAGHDAATAYLGTPWRMPTDAEFSALISNCITTWITTNGVSGRLVTGRGAYAFKSIFLPAAGCGYVSILGSPGSRGCYWSSTPDSDDSDISCYIDIYSSYIGRGAFGRCEGQSVRPVRGVVIGTAGVTTHLKLDCRTGIRESVVEGEMLRYDASWYENGSLIRIADDGAVVSVGVIGSHAWRPRSDSSAPHLLTMEVLNSEGRIIATETAQFALGYIRNVTARQLWPHNKVAIAFTVAEDIGEVKCTNEDLSVWCARGWITNLAMRVSGDRLARPGIHRIVWDFESEGLRFANDETIFGVSVEKVSEGSVQLWEDGPYWAECNVGASKPEECGYYFWWGDTVGYKRNADNDGWVSVKDGTAFSFSSDNCPTYDKNNLQLQSAGYIDSMGNLVAAHDAATAYFGAPWRMPTDAEWSALINSCDITLTMRNGVWGRLVTGRGVYSLRSIFLPAADVGFDSRLIGAGSCGNYWSSTPDSGNSYLAWFFYFTSSNFRRYDSDRYWGQSVRPLREFAK